MSARLKIFFLSLYLILNSLSLRAQTYNFRNYSVDDGLPFIQVSCIFQDSKGYLWTGGYGGLSRFDGKNFVNYAPKDGLADHFVTCISESDNELWVGTINGLSIFDGKKFTNFYEKDGLPDNHINALYNNGHQIIVGTEKGGADRKDGKFRGSNDGHNVKCFLDINNGATSYEGTNTGIYVHGKSSENKLLNRKNGLCNDRINAFASDKQNNLWIATDSGLSYFSNENFTNYHIKDGLPDEKINALSIDAKGNVWIGTNKGLCKYDGKKFKTYLLSEKINSNLVGCLYLDFEDNLWIGTYSGLYKHRDDAFISFTEKDGLTSTFVYPILRGKHNELWVGTNAGGLFRYANNKFTSFTTKDGLSGNTINHCIMDRDSVIWLGTDKGLSQLVESNGRISFINYYKKDGLISDSVTFIMQDKNGSFWLGGQEGVTTFDKKTKKFDRIRFPGPQKNYDVWSIYEDSKYNIWFGTYLGGLYRYNVAPQTKDEIHYYNEENPAFKSTSAFGIVEDKLGHLYFGTLEGVFMYDGKKFEQFSERNGMSSDLVYSILLDNGGKTLWVGTNQGLNKIDLEEFNRTGKKVIEPYGKEEGFMGVECNSGAFRDADGTIWFGTVNGLIKYDPKEFRVNEAESRTSIIGTSIFYQDTVLKNNVELNWYDNNISFDFIGICLTNPAKVRYSYILEGADKDWSPITKNTFARFSNLGPGTYTFKVKSRNNEGKWNVNPASFTFTVLTPWWKTWWFRMFLIVSVVSGVYFAVRLRIRRIQWNENNKVRLANNELKALRAQMNPHFIFNALNSIQHFIMNSDENGASKYLNKFAKLIRSILNNTEKTTVSLKDEVESLRLYIELEMLRFESKFDFEIKVDTNTDLDFYEVPTLLIQPYVENAIIHGLVPKKEKGHLAINIRIENNFIICEIIDNGIGRKNSSEIKASSIKKGHKSLGMKITRDRLELLNSVRNSSLSVNITDQIGSGGEAEGTKVEIFIPIV